ncbi:MAG: MFS transporter [Chloroflexi bacterium]|nr:MFS transporter [Chloroflexota bacterium]
MTELCEAVGRGLLRNRFFLYLWMAQALTQTAQNALFYGLLVSVEERTASTVSVSLLIVAAIAPAILFGLAAGVFVDRVRKRRVLIVSNLLRVPVVVALAGLDGSIALVYLLTFLFNTITQFFGPAELSTIPLIVRRSQLVTANGLFHLTWVGSQMAGFVVLGPSLVKGLGVTSLLWALALIYVVAAALVSLIPDHEPEPAAGSVLGAGLLAGLRRELQDGWKLIHGQAAMALAMVHLTVTATLMLILGMLAPGYVTRVIGIPAADAMYVLSPAGVGMLVAAVILPRLAMLIPKDRLINAGLLGTGACLIILALTPRAERFVERAVLPVLAENVRLPDVVLLVAAVMILALALGWFVAMVGVPAQTVLQEAAPTHMRARVFAVQFTFGNAAGLLPLLFLGALADLFGVALVIALIGGFVLLLALYSIRQTRRLIPDPVD